MPEVVGSDAAFAWIRDQTWPDAKAYIQKYATSSFVHPYGFSVIRTEIPYLTDWQARIHFWEPASVNETAGLEVHSHGWNMISKVLIGGVEEESFTVIPKSGGGWKIYAVSSSVSEGTSTLTLTDGEYRLNAQPRFERRNSMDPYLIETGRFHQTSNSSGILSVSLALTSTPSSGKSFVATCLPEPAVTFQRRSTPSIEDLINRADHAYRSEFKDEDNWAAFAFIRDPSGRIAMARTKRNPDHWMPIGGRAKRTDSSPLGTLVREIFEEVGIRAIAADLRFIGRRPRDVGDGYTHFWTLEIGRDTIAVPNMQEFDEFSWFHVEEIPHLTTFQGTRDIVQIL